ncbi:MAG: hypothetical protein OMM_05366 [Candidatus Magnetoglobus multicellularis str. Araruama]|uniref:Uncharacterized protein n=1 Tax=Candidatus Magnetoglobus multicellularis str. Araruama TaxID=890399 RepID=A0A1V1NWP7_9BACT|nr:MAG: hypothetical protein OMM_05366 [Candidatus Magnetoglobus multicellularis str. Araruama]
MAPLGVLVSTDFKIMSDSPRADILIIKKKTGKWTPDQLRLIPDGIRESEAKYIIIEFKYTQSLSDKTFQQALGYDYFFGESYHLHRNELQTFIVSAKTPQGQILNDYGYAGTNIKGVLKSDIRAFNHFPLLILNDLPLDYHNALIKAFASRKVQRDRASKLLQDKQYLNIIHKGVKNIIIDIFKYIFRIQTKDMTMEEISEEKAAQMARFIDVFVNTNLSLQEVLSLYKPEEIISQFKPEDVIPQFKPKDVISQFKPKDVISQFKPKDVISQLKPEDILSSLDKKQLKQLKRRINMM